jgi:hypothetical protein
MGVETGTGGPRRTFGRRETGMKTLCIVAVVILAGCGSHIAPTGMTGAGFASPATQSWMLPGTSSGNDLLYVAGRNGAVYAVTYPQGEVVGEVGLPYETNSGGICSDGSGDIFVPDRAEIVEFAHGGTQPIATLSDGGGYYQAIGCSIDPTSGNLAVTNSSESGYRGNVAIYANAQGDPTYYSDSDMYGYKFCGYDDHGNLFVSGSPSGLAELPSGSGTFINITLNKNLYGNQVQWDGKYITLQTKDWIYRISVSGSAGRIVGRTLLKGLNPNNGAQSWIQGNTAIAPDGRNSNRVGFWKYPRGGKALTLVHLGRFAEVVGVTVSVSN